MAAGRERPRNRANFRGERSTSDGSGTCEGPALRPLLQHQREVRFDVHTPAGRGTPDHEWHLDRTELTEEDATRASIYGARRLSAALQ